MTELIGHVLGDYQIEALVKAGSALDTFRARHVQHGHLVALKVLHPNLLATPDVGQRFLQAVQATITLQHPNLVSVLDTGVQEGRYYLVTEWLEDGSLRTLLRRWATERDTTTPLTVGVDLVRQAADGLAYLHAQQRVHGTLHPGNLLLLRLGSATPEDERYVLKLDEAGLSQLLLNADETLPLEAMSGSPPYLSPEQCQGLAVDERSDIYALGIILYEVCTGYVPFAVKTLSEAAAKHPYTRPTPPRVVRPDLPPTLEAIILRCLAKAPEQRFATAAELSAELYAILHPNAATTVLPPLEPDAPEPALDEAAPDEAAPDAPTTFQPVPAASTQSATTPLSSPEAVPQLQVFDAQGRLVQALDLTHAGVTIGRQSDNTLPLSHAAISRRHLRIDWDGQNVTLTDLGSSNGTHLGPHRLPPQVPQPWPWNEVVQIGPFRLHLIPPPSAPATGADLLDSLLVNVPPPTTGYQTPMQATQFSGGERITVQLDQEHLVLTPGQPAVAHLTLLNQGNSVDYVTISVEGFPGAWTRGPQQPIQVTPGVPTSATLNLMVPRTPESRAGDYVIIVRVRSATNQADSGTVRGQWTVLPFVSSTLTLSPRTARGRNVADYQVLLRNQGNAPVYYRLVAEDVARALNFEFGQEQILLEPGQTADIALIVTRPQQWFGTTRTYPFTVWAETADEQVPSATAQFTQSPLAPIWVPLLVLVAALLVIILAIIIPLLDVDRMAGVGTPTPTALPTETPTTEPGAPVVNLFGVEPREVAPGQPVNVVWNVEGAERVQIEQFGDVEPQGQREHRPEITTDYRLVAISGGQTTTRIERVTVQSPTPVPTETPLPPPTETPLPAPTETPLPAPTETPLPAPTETPLPAPTETPLPPPASIDLLDQASAAVWRIADNTIPFGRPAQPGDGWVNTQSNVTLEDNNRYRTLLVTVPPLAGDRTITGQFNLPTLASGQHFLAQAGFAADVSAGEVTIRVRFNNESLYQRVKQPDNQLLMIDIDLSAFAGQTGALTIEVVSNIDDLQDELFWSNMRVGPPT